MKTFKQILSESKTIQTKKFGKIEATFKKASNNKVEAFIDDTKLDTFKNIKDAEQGVKDYLELIGK